MQKGIEWIDIKSRWLISGEPYIEILRAIIIVAFDFAMIIPIAMFTEKYMPILFGYKKNKNIFQNNL